MGFSRQIGKHPYSPGSFPRMIKVKPNGQLRTQPASTVTVRKQPVFRQGARKAILVAQALSYALIITFIFADARFALTGIFHNGADSGNIATAYVAACLVGLVGSINIWLTWHYATKSNSMRDMLVICAWTHRVKSNGRWLSLEEFFTEQLGFSVSHGLSDAKLTEMRQEIDRDWRRIARDASATGQENRQAEQPSSSFGFNSLQPTPPSSKERQRQATRQSPQPNQT